MQQIQSGLVANMPPFEWGMGSYPCPKQDGGLERLRCYLSAMLRNRDFGTQVNVLNSVEQRYAVSHWTLESLATAD